MTGLPSTTDEGGTCGTFDEFSRSNQQHMLNNIHVEATKSLDKIRSERNKSVHKLELASTILIERRAKPPTWCFGGGGDCRKYTAGGLVG